MPLLALYLIKLSISLAAAWLFYQLFLRRLTFYSWNRWYLLGYSLLSFFIPLINIAGAVRNDTAQGATVIKYIPVIGNYRPSMLGGWDIAYRALALGALILLARLGSRWLSLSRIRRQATLMSDEGSREGVRIYQVDEPIIPFSFGNAIYINAGQHTEKEWSAIVLHEYVHIRQRHTLDILLAELCCALNWYNPFAWLIRQAIRQNLEFIADSKVLEKGLDKKGYQYHLLKVIGEPRYRLANNFNFSSLKKRIIMMNKIQSARLHLVKFLFLLPLLTVLLVAFRGQYKEAAHRPATTYRSAVDTQHLRKDTLFPRKDTLSRGKRTLSLPQKDVLAPPQKAALPPPRMDTLPSPQKDTLKGPPPAGVVLKLHLIDWTGNRKGIDSMKKQLPKVLYLVDGIQTPREEVAKTNPNQIATINILKWDQTATYGPKAGDGVILIYTRDYVALHPGKDEEDKNTMTMRQEPVMVALDAVDNNYKGLIIVDGKDISREELKKLQPQKIGVMEVLKGEVATKRYGEKGKDGVILITSKK